MGYENSGKRKPINLFLVEIIIALLFFSISGAVIMKVFAVADAKSRRSALLEEVMVVAQSIAESYSCNGDANAAVRDAAGIIVYEDLSAVPLNGGTVIMSVLESRVASGAGELCGLSIEFTMEGSEIYSLNCSTYFPGGETNE